MTPCLHLRSEALNPRPHPAPEPPRAAGPQHPATAQQQGPGLPCPLALPWASTAMGQRGHVDQLPERRLPRETRVHGPRQEKPQSPKTSAELPTVQGLNRQTDGAGSDQSTPDCPLSQK